MNPYSQPCMCMIDLKPRNGKLYLTHQFFVQIEYLKVVIQDYTALTEMGHFLTEQSGLELGKVTTLHVHHIGDMDNEKENNKIIRSFR